MSFDGVFELINKKIFCQIQMQKFSLLVVKPISKHKLEWMHLNGAMFVYI